MAKFGTFKFGIEKFGTYTSSGGPGPLRPRLGDGFFSSRPYIKRNGAAAKRFAVGETLFTPTVGNLILGADMTTQALKDAVERQISNFDLKFYIQDEAAAWVDFTDRMEWRGKNQLRKIGQLSYTAERRVGALRQTISNVTLDNSDHFWDKPFPPNLKATLNSDLEFLDDASSTASWNASTNGQTTIIFRHKAMLRASYVVNSTGDTESITLGIFLVEDISTNSESTMATLSLVPLANTLINSPADRVKAGLSWYSNRPPKFLVEQLLEEHFLSSTGSLPTTFDIENLIDIEVPLSGTNAWVSSHFGRPPERLIKNADISAGTITWNSDEPRTAKALGQWEYGQSSDTKGTVTLTPGSAVVTGASTVWSSGIQPPRVGDAFIVPKEYYSGDGGSTLDNHGKFTIASIDSDTQITLDQVLQGSAAEATITYSIIRIYVGVGSGLYEYNPATDTYQELTTGDDDLGSSYTIFRIWHNTNADVTSGNEATLTSYPMWGAGISDPTGTRTSTLKIFRFKWDSLAADFEVTSTITGVELCHTVHRNSTTVDGDEWIGASSVPSPDVEMAPITLPYDQYVVSVDGSVVDLDAGTSFTNKTTFSSVERDDVSSTVLEKGYWTARRTLPSGVDFRSSVGQTGLLLYDDSFSPSGAVIYVKPQTVSSDYYPYNYYFTDLSDASETQIDSGASTDLTTYTDYIPTAGCMRSGVMFVGATKFNQTAREAQSVIIKVDSITGAPTTNLIHDDTGGSPDNLVFLEMYAHADIPNVYASTLQMDYVLSETNKKTTAASKHALYWWINTLVVAGTKAPSYYSNNMIQGLHHYDNDSGGSGSQEIRWMTSPGGIMHSFDDGTNDITAVPEKHSALTTRPAIVDDEYLSTNLIFSPSTMEAYWITGTEPQTNIISLSEGKRYLSKWSSSIPLRVELADFNGMTQWQAIKSIAEISDAVFGFMPDGNFFFKRRPTHASSSYSFTNTGQDRLFSIQKGTGYGDIVNESSRLPSFAGLSDIDISIQLAPNSKYGKASEDERHTVDGLQRDLDAKVIRLVCIQGGRTATGLDTEVEAEFTYIVSRSTTQTTLDTAYVAGDEWVYISDVDDVVYGTSIDISGVDGSDNEVTATGRVGNQLAYSGVGLTVNTTGGINDVTSEIEVNIADITIGADNGYTLQSGDILLIADIANEQKWEYVQVLYTEAQKLHVVRGIGGNQIGAVSHAINDNIYLIRNATQVFTYATLDAVNGYAVGDRINLDHPGNGDSSDTYLQDPNTTSDNDPTQSKRRVWHPIDGKFAFIGGENTPYSTNMALKFDFSGTSRSDEPKFTKGDLIRIKTDGLVLQENSSARKLAQDMSSRKTWGRRDSKDQQGNKFYNEHTALWAALREVSDKKDPKYEFTITTLLTPWLSLLDVVDVQDPNVLPNSTQRKEACYIESISFPSNMAGLQTVTLKAINAY